jgi:membrane-bound lytic murein transglycosylase F
MISDYDQIVKEITGKLWPGLDWLIIKCQIAQESSFNPNAVSPCGARGLLQLMYATASDLRVKQPLQPKQLFDPETNLLLGITYLKIQFDHFKEIPDREERIKFSLASYNGGRGYINAAIKIATIAAKVKGAPALLTWDVVSEYLAYEDCQVNGKHPDHKQITDYVKRIWDNYNIEKEKA